MSFDLPENIRRKLDEIAAHHDELDRQLLDPSVTADHRRVRTLATRRAALAPIVDIYRRYVDARRQIDELTKLLADPKAERDLKQLAEEELATARTAAAEAAAMAQERLITAEDRAIGSVIIEIRAGVGGDEAMLWAGDLLDMYRRFAADKGWTFEEITMSSGDAFRGVGGVRQVIVNISGEGVWAELGYEGGTHQVKRVPATEAQGRIHTSTATVAVLPEPEEVEVELDPDDVRESITTAQGPGGQNVNKVATAVHLIHEPTGIEVRMQETKSQHRNRERAWQLLKARLYERQKHELDAQRAESRNAMIGRAGRAEKIRTYRYKENLVVDHRIGESFNLSEIMAGRLQPLIDALIEYDTAQRLAAL